MSNIINSAKRKRISRIDKIVKRNKQMAHYAQVKEDLKLYFDTIPIITNWCDNGETKPKCNRCPICQNIQNGGSYMSVKTLGQNTSNSHLIPMPSENKSNSI